MATQNIGAFRAEQRERIAALLARYPNLPASELERIHHWFRREACALDVGLVASEPAIAAQYRAYRADHYDRFTPVDYGRAALFVLATLAVVWGIALLMP